MAKVTQYLKKIFYINNITGNTFSAHRVYHVPPLWHISFAWYCA